MTYHQLLEKKRHSINDFGIKPNFMLDTMFDYQKYIAEKSILRGRCANYLDTGTGKTLIELVHAVNYIRHTNKPVLIICPLAVAFQFIKEAEKFQIDDIEYSKNGKYSKKIVVCNYERLEKFNASDFDCAILDESSILKNSEGVTSKILTAFLRKIKYRYLFTATPSPNDYVELGTSSEALGFLGYTDMLGRFFKNNEDTISPQKIGTKWQLKSHATEDFFKWVSSWSLSMRKPSDLGFSDNGFELPKLTTNFHSVFNEKNLIVNGQIQMFNRVAKTQSEIRSENSLTVEGRCNKAFDLAKDYDTSVYWCNLDREGDLLNKLDKDAYQIKGSMDVDKKEEILVAFSNGEIKKLITKASMTGFGLNWQHCRHTVVFPTFSHEQYYQLIRRFWRYGQKQEVIADVVYSDGQKRVIDSLFAKGEKSDKLFEKLNSTINSEFIINSKEFNKNIILPNFLNK